MTAYIVAALIAILALIPPVSIHISMTVNSTPWLWIVLLSGFLGLFFLNTKSNIWIKLIVVYSFINCFLSRAPYLSFSIYSSVVASAYFYLLCKQIKKYKVIYEIHHAIFLLYVILIVMQLFKTDTLLNFNRPEPVILGTIGNTMVMGSFVAVALAPFVIAYRKLNIVPLIIIAFIAGSSGTILALFMGVIFYLFFKIKRKCVYLIILLILSAGLFSYVRTRGAVVNFWKGGRGPIWKRTVELANEYPLEGQGIGTFKVIFPVKSQDIAGAASPGWIYEATEGNWIAWRRTHNTWLQLLFETGRIGFGLFLGLVGSLVWKFIKTKKTEPVILAMAGLIIIGTDMTIHFPFRMEQGIPSMICFLAYFEFLTKRGVIKCEKQLV